MSEKHEDRRSFGKLQFDVSLESGAARTRRDPEAPFALAVLGDFSGRFNRGVTEPVGERRVWRVDCDNFEEVLGKLAPRLRLSLPSRPGEAAEFRFATMDDFHPDQLVRQDAPLAALLEERRQLRDPATAAAAANRLQELLNRLATPPASQPAATAAAESDGDTLARLLGGTPRPPASAAAGPGGAGLDRLLQSIVAPSVVPSASPQQTALLSLLDLELARQLRAILRQPDFQALESAWRGADRLVRNFGAEDNLKLFLIDVSKDELAADVRSEEALDSSGLSRLVRRQAEELRWAVWLGLYTFADTLADIELLGGLAGVSAWARLPFLADASPHLAGCDSFHLHPDADDWKQPIPADVRAAWRALRELPAASYVGLALPRFLLRQPYGKDSEPIESFLFEELPGDHSHEAFLWGNSAILCGHLLAAAFQAEGWEMRTSGYGEVGDLPVYKFREEGETKVKPCAEAWLSDRAAEAIFKQGLMPVLSVRGRDAARLAGLQSLAGRPLPVS
jgi:type VI secretion system protein ImpC